MLVLLGCSGCSLLFQNRLSGDYRGVSEPQCDRGKGLVTLDAVLGAADVGLGIASLVDNNPAISSNEKTTYAVFSFLDAAVFTISALAGNAWANDCRDAWRRWEQGRAEP